jgi:small-conductance mechanosensitive channel
MDVQQAINLAIYERLEREGVEFAQPARAVRVKAGRALESAEA